MNSLVIFLGVSALIIVALAVYAVRRDMRGGYDYSAAHQAPLLFTPGNRDIHGAPSAVEGGDLGGGDSGSSR